MKLRVSSILIKAFFFIFLFFSSGLLAAGEKDYPANYYDIVALFLILIIIIGFIALVYFEGKTELEEVEVAKDSLFKKFRQFVTRSAPIEKEHEILIDDHEYDGIRELDNKVPPWFSWLFYVSIVFAVYYMLHYHVFETGKLQAEEYAEEIQFAELRQAELIKSGAFINEETVTLLTDTPSIQSGIEVYKTNCVACHGSAGEGIVGPNLTDKNWVHGGGIRNIFKVIKYGVPAKGMIAWQSQLSPKQIQDVSSYIITLEGTNPPNPKQAEGEVWVDEVSNEASGE